MGDETKNDEQRDERPEAQATATEEEVERLRKERDELEDRYRRALADLENTRKRLRRELEEMRHFGHVELARDILPIVDDLERALGGVPEERRDDPLVVGVQMVLERLLKVLRDHGIEPIEAQGQPFDPQHHEAIEHVEREDVPPNTVVGELYRGYRVRDRLLRASGVSVSRKPESDSRREPDAAEGEERGDD